MQVKSRPRASIGVASGLLAAFSLWVAIPAIAPAADLARETAEMYRNALAWVADDCPSSQEKATENEDSLGGDSATIRDEGEAKPSRKRKSKRRRGGNPSDRHFNPTVQRYLPEDCTVFGWLEIDPVLHSEIGRRLRSMGADFKNECDERFAPFDLTTDQIDRIVFGGRSLDDGDLSDYVAIVFCNQPVSAESWQSGGETDLWKRTKVGQQWVWVKQDQKQWAVCAVEDRILLAGTAGQLRGVLSRRGSARLPDKLDAVRRELDPSTALAMAFLPENETGQLDSLASTFGGDLTNRVEAVSVQISFDSDLLVRMGVFCRDKATAKQLDSIGSGLLALVRLQDLEDQEPDVRRLVQSIVLDTSGSQLTATMTVPGEMAVVERHGAKQLAKSAPWQILPFAATPMVTMNTTTPKCVPCPATPTTVPPVASAPGYPVAGAQYNPSSTATPAFSNPSPYPLNSSGVYHPSQGAVGYPTAIPAPSAQRATLSIDDVIRMVEAEVDDTVIVRHIQKHCLAAPLTADDLILLTKSGTDVSVISALQELPLTAKEEAKQKAPTSKPPALR